MKKRYKRLAVGMGIATVVAGSLLSYNLIFNKTSYTVSRVIDGDTFETVEKQRVRIDGIQAPEIGMCGAEKATEALTKLALNRKVFIKVRYLDEYRRMVAEVYDQNGKLVAEELASDGVAIVRQKGEPNDNLLAAGNKAREKGIGLYGLPCTQETNLQKPDCTIKGNMRLGTDDKFYHRPDCRNYKLTKVQLYLGDEWFCTEEEAQRAGFKKGEDCN